MESKKVEIFVRLRLGTLLLLVSVAKCRGT